MMSAIAPEQDSHGLPPGPRMSSAAVTAIWARHAQWMMSQCAARFGETFSLRLLHEDPWVMVSNPEHVKQVFTGDPSIFHAGEGNRILLPVLGENSLLLLDERPHMHQRKLLLAPLHGTRMQGYAELMTEVAREEIAQWPTGVAYRLRPRMQAITLEIILRAVFGVQEPERLADLRGRLRRLLDVLTSPLMLGVLVLGPERLVRGPTVRADARGRGWPHLRRDPAPPPGGRSRPAPRHPVAAAAGARRGWGADERPRAA